MKTIRTFKACNTSKHFRPECRVTSERHAATPRRDGLLFTRRVQIRNSFGFWQTVWAATCPDCDFEQCRYIMNCADEVAEALTQKI